MQNFAPVIYGGLSLSKKGTPIVILKNLSSGENIFVAVNSIDANRLAIASLSFLTKKINNLPHRIIESMGGRLKQVNLSVDPKGAIVSHLIIELEDRLIRIETRSGEGIFIAQNNGCPLFAERALFSVDGEVPKSLKESILRKNSIDCMSVNIG